MSTHCRTCGRALGPDDISMCERCSARLVRPATTGEPGLISGLLLLVAPYVAVLLVVAAFWNWVH